MTAYVVQIENQNGVKETPLSTKCSARSASRLAEKPSMKVNLDGMHIPKGKGKGKGSSKKLTLETTMMKVLYGILAHLIRVEKK